MGIVDCERVSWEEPLPGAAGDGAGCVTAREPPPMLGLGRTGGGLRAMGTPDAAGRDVVTRDGVRGAGVRGAGVRGAGVRGGRDEGTAQTGGAAGEAGGLGLGDGGGEAVS